MNLLFRLLLRVSRRKSFLISFMCFPSCSCTALAYPCVHITEQFTDEQEGTVTAIETESDVDSKALELALEASHMKDNVPLSLTDDVKEVVVQDSLSEDISLDATVVSGENDQEKAVAAIHGWFLSNQLE